MHSRLTRTRSSGEDEATHFGPRSQVSACSTWAVARSSARSRRSVAAARIAAKFGGSLRWVAASMSASMSLGRRPVKKRATTSGDTAKAGARQLLGRHGGDNRLAVDQTPLQSKMNTGGPRFGRRSANVRIARAIRVARLWTRDACNESTLKRLAPLCTDFAQGICCEPRRHGFAAVPQAAGRSSLMQRAIGIAPNSRNLAASGG